MSHLSFSPTMGHLTIHLRPGGDDEATLLQKLETLGKDGQRFISLHISGAKHSSGEFSDRCAELLKRTLGDSKVELLVGPQSSSEAATSEEDVAMADVLIRSGLAGALSIKGTCYESVVGLAKVAVDHDVTSFAFNLGHVSFLHDDFPNPSVKAVVDTLSRSEHLQRLVIEAGRCWVDDDEGPFEVLLGNDELAAVLGAMESLSLEHLGWVGHQLGGYDADDFAVCQRLFAQPLHSLDLSRTTCMLPPERLGDLRVHSGLQVLGLNEALRTTVMGSSDAEHLARWVVAQCERAPKLRISLQNNMKPDLWRHGAQHADLASVQKRLQGCPPLRCLERTDLATLSSTFACSPCSPPSRGCSPPEAARRLVPPTPP